MNEIVNEKEEQNKAIIQVLVVIYMNSFKCYLEVGDINDRVKWLSLKENLFFCKP